MNPISIFVGAIEGDSPDEPNAFVIDYASKETLWLGSVPEARKDEFLGTYSSEGIEGMSKFSSTSTTVPSGAGTSQTLHTNG